MYIGFRLDKSMTLSDFEYEGATVGYCQLSGLLVFFHFSSEAHESLQKFCFDVVLANLIVDSSDELLWLLIQRNMDVASASLLEIPPQLAYVFSKLDGRATTASILSNFIKTVSLFLRIIVLITLHLV